MGHRKIFTKRDILKECYAEVWVNRNASQMASFSLKYPARMSTYRGLRKQANILTIVIPRNQREKFVSTLL